MNNSDIYMQGYMDGIAGIKGNFESYGENERISYSNGYKKGKETSATEAFFS